MSDQSNVARLREGFIDPDKPVAPQPHAQQPHVQQPHVQQPPPVQVPSVPGQAPGSAMPPPEIEPSLVEQDRAPEVVQERWPIVVRLMYKPLVIPGQPTLHELSFREPRAGDINRYGNPCRINGEGDVMIEERKMHYIMAALSGVLPPYLEMLDTRDWNSCAFRLRHFFIPDPRAWSLEQTNR